MTNLASNILKCSSEEASQLKIDKDFVTISLAGLEEEIINQDFMQSIGWFSNLFVQIMQWKTNQTAFLLGCATGTPRKNPLNRASKMLMKALYRTDQNKLLKLHTGRKRDKYRNVPYSILSFNSMKELGNILFCNNSNILDGL